MNQTNVVDRWEQNRVRHSHEHAPPLNVNQALVEMVTPGERMADSFALVIGSWKFMIVQSLILTAWIVANVMVWVQHWDSYPFILLLNLALSFQAAYAAPIIMMSQNRQAAKDRLMAEQDYLVNTKAEEEVKAIMHHLEQQDEAMIDILRRMEQQHHAIISGFAAMGFNGSGTPAPV
jgi:uncharacterized membrane protein